MQENEINNAKKELANLYLILKLGESYKVTKLLFYILNFIENSSIR